MKEIIHVITTINRGGAENQLLILVREQVKTGNNVKVVSLKGEPELKQELELSGAVVDTSLNSKNPLIQSFLLAKFITDRNVILHAHLPRAELVATLIPRRFRLFTSRHNAEPFFPGAPRLISNLLSKLVEIRAVKIIAISNAVRDYVVDRGEVMNKAKIIVAYYGYQTHNSPQRVHDFTKPILKLGTISRLAEQKDLKTLIRVFAKYNAIYPKATLSILGAGPLENELKNIASGLGVADSVIFLGRSSEVLAYLSSLDLFLLTSKYEGFGMVLFEAMDAQIPIIASNNSAIPEVLGEKHPGLCKTGDIEDFLERIIQFNQAITCEKVINFQNLRLEEFKAEVMNLNILEVYNK